MTLGNRILELRARLGLSQEDFGELFGATRQTVSRWELDQAIPEIQKIVQMARMLGVTTDSIISDGISTFDCTFDRFVCGVYRKKDIVIAETERIALVYRDCGKDIFAELYEGLQDNKVLRATVEFDLTEKKAKYAYLDDGGRIFANFEAESVLGHKFDRAQLDGMKRIETFTVSASNKNLPTVPEAGFRTCLKKWREGTKYYCREGQIFASIYVNGINYFFHMMPLVKENIYCGFIAEEPFELGNFVGMQHFRIRNFDDNQDTQSYSLISDQIIKAVPPSGENGIEFNEDNAASMQQVLRYGNDWITVSNCGGELTYTRNDPDMIEWVES